MIINGLEAEWKRCVYCTFFGWHIADVCRLCMVDLERRAVLDEVESESAYTDALKRL